MKLLISSVLAALVSFSSASAQSKIEETARLFMPDGQLKSHLIKVLISQDISEGMHPRLAIIDATTAIGHGTKEWSTQPALVAPRQVRVMEIEGEQVQVTGTAFLFDLSRYPVPYYKAMTRITPKLEWDVETDESNGTMVATTSESVYLGNPTGALGWTAVLLLGFVAVVASLSHRSKGYWLALLFLPSGKLSLSKTQVSAWTLAIGGLVFMFGLIRLEVPDFPNSLLALMGLSLATGGISYAKKPPSGPDDGPSSGAEARENGLGSVKSSGRRRRSMSIVSRLSDLISDQDDLSISRAQMLFWTVLLLALFIIKSLIDGVLWEVPWELVALMGMSQGAYLAPKFAEPKQIGQDQATVRP
jgi:hypothetical protein